MRVVSEKPLIFIDTPSIDEIAVEFRRAHKMLQDTIKITHSNFADLKELIDENSSITYGIVKTGEPDPEGVPIVKVENMKDDRTIDVDGLSRVSPAVSNKYARTILQPKDILVSIKGTIGRIAEVPNCLAGGNITRDLALIRLKDKASNSFIMLYLESELAQLQMTLHSRGAAVKGINLSDLREVKVPLINDENKKLISERFSSIREVSAVIQKTCNSLREQEHQNSLQNIDHIFSEEFEIKFFPSVKKQKVFLRNAAYAERLDIPANHPDYTRLVDMIKTSPVAGTLADLVEVSDEHYDPREHVGEEVHYLAIGDVDGITGQIIGPQVMPAETLPSRARRLIHSGDILIGIAGASTGTENMVVFPVSEDEEGWVASTGFIVLRPRNTVSVSYVCRLLKAPFILRQIRALLTSPSMPTISESDLLNLSVPVTDEKTRAKTLERIEAVLNEEKVLSTQLNDISKRADALLAKAKSNIFDLLDDKKFTVMSAEAEELKQAMKQIEEALQ